MTDIESKTISKKVDVTEEIIKEKVDKIMALYFKRFEENVNRTTNLVNLWMLLKDNPEFSSNIAIDEILRASVVFTHATLEDFLRTLSARLYPEASEQTLNQIPLIGPDSSFGRTEKFYLGRLAQFRGRTVNEVIENSVFKYLEHSNFNTVTDISALLEKLGIEVSKVNSSFPKIEELMKRRHSIVHRADRSEPIGSNEQNIQKIEGKDVGLWIEAVIRLVAAILPEAINKHFGNESRST